MLLVSLRFSDSKADTTDDCDTIADGVHESAKYKTSEADNTTTPSPKRVSNQQYADEQVYLGGLLHLQMGLVHSHPQLIPYYVPTADSHS